MKTSMWRDWIAGIFCSILLTGCDMLEAHPYDVHIDGEKNITEKNISLIEAKTKGKEVIRFAMISDTQRFYDETDEVVRTLNQRDDIDFVLHGGDLTEYGATKEFIWQRNILNKLKVPYLCVIGNHDCLATGIECYEAIFGNLNFSFKAGNVKFLCLNTNAIEFDYNNSVPDMSFLKNELANLEHDINKTVVLMHSGPFSDQFNNNIAEEFHNLLTKFPNIQFCLYGHGHSISVDDFFDDGIIYYECPTIKKKCYLLMTINEDGSYNYEAVEF